MKNEKKTIMIAVVILLLAIVATVGASYAYFATTTKTTGNDKNLNIVTEDLGSIKWEGTKVYTSGDLLPGECGIQTFTIEKNSASGKGIYEIDLKGILDESFGTDVEITLYKSTDATNNNVTIKEGESTISGDTTKQYYKEDSVVLNGTPEKVYGTKALQNKDPIILEQKDFDNSTLSKTTYYLVYCYKNADTAQDAQQGKSFSGEISVRLILEKITKLNEYVENVALDTMLDDFGNTRYIGANPNNYVKIDYDGDDNYVFSICSPVESACIGEFSTIDECENELNNYDATIIEEYQISCAKKQKYDIWRIIGVMKDVDDGTGNKSDRVKLIRSEAIGKYSWDTSESSVNSGYGVNEWSQADIMKLLNPGYESETVGGSLYWNSGTGTCYNGQNNATTPCDFTSTGIKDKLKVLIGDAVWNTGANDGKTYKYNNIITSKFYELERSSNTGKICSSGNYCNDTVERTTTWIGKVGLMYPSDYGYATSGGSTTDRATCLNTKLYSWDSSNVSDCENNDWLYNSGSYQWTLSPNASSSDAHYAFAVAASGDVYYNAASNGDVDGVRPVVYLTSNVGIQSGDGSSGNPFILG